jgi:hypothetical protein
MRETMSMPPPAETGMTRRLGGPALRRARRAYRGEAAAAGAGSGGGAGHDFLLNLKLAIQFILARDYFRLRLEILTERASS